MQQCKPRKRLNEISLLDWFLCRVAAFHPYVGAFFYESMLPSTSSYAQMAVSSSQSSSANRSCSGVYIEGADPDAAHCLRMTLKAGQMLGIKAYSNDMAS